MRRIVPCAGGASLPLAGPGAPVWATHFRVRRNLACCRHEQPRRRSLRPGRPGRPHASDSRRRAARRDPDGEARDDAVRHGRRPPRRPRVGPVERRPRAAVALRPRGRRRRVHRPVAPPRASGSARRPRTTSASGRRRRPTCRRPSRSSRASRSASTSRTCTPSPATRASTTARISSASTTARAAAGEDMVPPADPAAFAALLPALARGTASRLELLAEYVASLDVARHGPARVICHVPRPGGIEGMFLAGRAAIREALFAGRVPKDACLGGRGRLRRDGARVRSHPRGGARRVADGGRARSPGPASSTRPLGVREALRVVRADAVDRRRRAARGPPRLPERAGLGRAPIRPVARRDARRGRPDRGAAGGNAAGRRLHPVARRARRDERRGPRPHGRRVRPRRRGAAGALPPRRRSTRRFSPPTARTRASFTRRRWRRRARRRTRRRSRRIVASLRSRTRRSSLMRSSGGPCRPSRPPASTATWLRWALVRVTSLG